MESSPDIWTPQEKLEAVASLYDDLLHLHEQLRRAPIEQAGVSTGPISKLAKEIAKKLVAVLPGIVQVATREMRDRVTSQAPLTVWSINRAPDWLGFFSLPDFGEGYFPSDLLDQVAQLLELCQAFNQHLKWPAQK